MNLEFVGATPPVYHETQPELITAEQNSIRLAILKSINDPFLPSDDPYQKVELRTLDFEHSDVGMWRRCYNYLAQVLCQYPELSAQFIDFQVKNHCYQGRYDFTNQWGIVDWCSDRKRQVSEEQDPEVYLGKDILRKILLIDYIRHPKGYFLSKRFPYTTLESIFDPNMSEAERAIVNTIFNVMSLQESEHDYLWLYHQVTQNIRDAQAAYYKRNKEISAWDSNLHYTTDHVWASCCERLRFAEEVLEALEAQRARDFENGRRML